MEEFRARERSKSEQPGFAGVVARAQLVVSPELTIWRAKEVNRGTDPNEIMNAIVMLVAATISGEVLGMESRPTEQFASVNRALQAVAEEIAAILTQPGYITNQRFETKEAGRA